jgi:penicillin-binding protein 2
MIVENAGFGAQNAAPIARRVFDYWLMDQYPSVEDIAAVQKAQTQTPIGTPRKASEMPWPGQPIAPAKAAAQNSSAAPVTR